MSTSPVLSTPTPPPIPFDDGQELAPVLATPNNTVLIAFIQDRSGSMQTVWDETLNGFDVFLSELRDKNVENINYLVSLTTFDTQIETPVVAKSIHQVSKADLIPHGPRGGTALLDAVGATIRNIEANLHGAGKVIVVITTDGEENSSREWKKTALSKLIEAKTEEGWVFTYLGTQANTWDEAKSIGISSGNTMSYTAGMSSHRNVVAAQAVKSFSESMDPYASQGNFYGKDRLGFTTPDVEANQEEYVKLMRSAGVVMKDDEEEEDKTHNLRSI